MCHKYLRRLASFQRTKPRVIDYDICFITKIMVCKERPSVILTTRVKVVTIPWGILRLWRLRASLPPHGVEAVRAREIAATGVALTKRVYVEHLVRRRSIDHERPTAQHAPPKPPARRSSSSGRRWASTGTSVPPRLRGGGGVAKGGPRRRAGNATGPRYTESQNSDATR